MKAMGLWRDEAAAQEIIGFMLAVAAVMLLFGAAVGYGLTVRDERIALTSEAAVENIARRLAEAVNDAAVWSEAHPDAHLNFTILLARMPGATGFVAEASATTLFINASNGEQAVRPLPSVLHGAVVGSISGTPERATLRWDPAMDQLLLETT